jgi:hypothetical protein
MKIGHKFKCIAKPDLTESPTKGNITAMDYYYNNTRVRFAQKQYRKDALDLPHSL